MSKSGLPSLHLEGKVSAKQTDEVEEMVFRKESLII